MMLVPTYLDTEWRDYLVQAQETLKQATLPLSSGAARRTYADLLHVSFSSDDASFILLGERLTELAGIVDDWDSYGAPTPNPETIASARRTIEKLRSNELLPEMVAPSAEGG